MRDPRDTVELGGRRASDTPARGPRRPFLAVWFRCCHTYGRLYRNADMTAYDGRCPACGATTRVPIGPDGTSRRLFSAE